MICHLCGDSAESIPCDRCLADGRLAEGAAALAGFVAAAHAATQPDGVNRLATALLRIEAAERGFGRDARRSELNEGRA